MTYIAGFGPQADIDVTAVYATVDLPCELRVGEAAQPVRLRRLSASGVEIGFDGTVGADVSSASEVVVVIPSLGQYKARRRHDKGGGGAEYSFEVTEFSRRALAALIADRFPT